MKDPSLRDTLYVEELIGPETISTMPEETIRAFQDHGRVEARLEGELDDARSCSKLAAAGVDYADVTATLEREGIEKFALLHRRGDPAHGHHATPPDGRSLEPAEQSGAPASSSHDGPADPPAAPTRTIG